MQRTVTRQVRYCAGSDASRPPSEAQPFAEDHHTVRTTFLCIYHVRAHPGCSDHEVQILGDWYGADEVACRLCIEEAA